jgi:hypothetical protein
MPVKIYMNCYPLNNKICIVKLFAFLPGKRKKCNPRRKMKETHYSRGKRRGDLPWTIEN